MVATKLQVKIRMPSNFLSQLFILKLFIARWVSTLARFSVLLLYVEYMIIYPSECFHLNIVASVSLFRFRGWILRLHISSPPCSTITVFDSVAASLMMRINTQNSGLTDLYRMTTALPLIEEIRQRIIIVRWRFI